MGLSKGNRLENKSFKHFDHDSHKSFVVSKKYPRKFKNPEGESMRQSLIIKFLVMIPDSRVIRLYNCPPFSSKDNKFIRKSSSLTPDGLPDLLFDSKKYGVHFFEVKSQSAFNFIKKHIIRLRNSLLKSHRHVKKQILLHDEYNERGNIRSHFVTTVDDVKRALNYEN
jgi:hypothetical protein